MNRALLKNGLILLALCICALLFAGCGAAESSASPGAGASAPPPPGVFVDATAEAWLRTEFEAVKVCAGIEQGVFEELTVVIMPPLFPCKHYVEGCSGEYVPPFTIKLGALGLWRHEVVHYLLDKKNGDADTGHASDLFRRCG